MSDVALLQRIASFAIVAVLAASAAGCAKDETLAGRVVDDVVQVSVPSLFVPLPDSDAGFIPASGSAGSGPTRTPASGITAITGIGQYSRVTSVPVAQGDRVQAGGVLAAFDAAALDADVVASQAALAAARAQLPVLDDALDDIASGTSELSSARSEIFSAIAKLEKTRAQLSEKRAQLRGVLGSLPPSVPATLPPGVPRPPGPDQLRGAIVQLDAGIAKIDTGLVKARSGVRRLASARGRLGDAKTQLQNARDLARIAADASKVAVQLAQWRRTVAVVQAPAAGVVVSVARVGDVLAPGATVAVVRPDGAARITTWVTPEHASAVRLGQEATVSGDWSAGESFPARVSLVGTRALYPPTSFATREVHLTRAVPIEVTVDSPVAALPPGAPADVRLR